MNDKKSFPDQFLAKIASLKEKSGVDLSIGEDLSLAIMNLISLEEHFYFTGVKTNKDEYFDLLNEVRSVRKSLLAKMMDKNEGETWCISKHLLASSMRLIEVGTKLQSDGKKEEAKEMFSNAHKVYSMFWAIRLKLVDASGFKQVAAKEKPWSYQDIVNKLVDCCDE